MKRLANDIPVSKLKEICEIMDKYELKDKGFVIFDIVQMKEVFNPANTRRLFENQILFTWNNNLKEWQLETWINQPFNAF